MNLDPKQIEAEIADLERKLAALRGVQVAYGLTKPKQGSIFDPLPSPPSRNGTGGVMEAIENFAGVQIMRPRRNSEYSARILNEAKALIEMLGGPVATNDILAVLERSGIAVRGDNPRNALSALLSNSPMFVANGRLGWTLAENTEAADASSPEKDASTASNEPRLISEGTQQSELRPGGGG